MYDLIILGGGPAGLTATVYAMQKRLETLLISEDLGGKANYRMHLRGLEGYDTLNGEEMVRKFHSQVEYLDSARLIDKVVSVSALPHSSGQEVFQVTTAGGASLLARALILATGVQPRPLNVPGEQRLLGLGISYSAISHAPLFWGKDTAVVGSGMLAMRAVGALASLASQVYLVAQDPLPEASPWLDKLHSLDRVTVLQNHQVIDVDGATYLEHVRVRSPEGQEQVIAVRGLFVELGLIPNTQLVQGLVDLDEQGRVKVDSRGATSRAGIYAAGDITNSYAEQVLIAIGDGAKAALSAYDYLLRRRSLARARRNHTP